MTTETIGSGNIIFVIQKNGEMGMKAKNWKGMIEIIIFKIRQWLK